MPRLPYVTRKKVTQPENSEAFLDVLKETPLESEVTQTVRSVLSMRKHGIGEAAAVELAAKFFAYSLGGCFKCGKTVERKWAEREARILADLNKVI